MTTMTMTTPEAMMIDRARKALNTKRVVLAPKAEAWVEYPDFDPCRVVEIIAIVHWPATRNCKEVTLHHSIVEEGE